MEEEIKTSAPTPSSDLVKPLRTYQSDIADTIKQKQGSVVKIAVAEEERRQNDKASTTLRSSKNRYFLLFSIIFVVLAGAIAFSFYFSKPKAVPFVAEVPLGEYTTIKTDAVSEIEIPQGDLLGFLKTFAEHWKGLGEPQNGIERVILSTKDDTGKKIILTPTQFLTLFETRTTPAFLRSLTDSLLVGVTVGTENHTFLLIKSNSYPNSFSGMLTWERGMFDDMKDFFSIPANSVTNISLFKDKVVKNQDTRVLVDDTGKTVLLYTFLGSNQDLLLITNNEAVVGIVADRLTQAKLAQ